MITTESILESFRSGLDPGFYLFSFPVMDGNEEVLDSHVTGFIINDDGSYYVFDPNYGIGKFCRDEVELVDAALQILLSYQHNTDTIKQGGSMLLKVRQEKI